MAAIEAFAETHRMYTRNLHWHTRTKSTQIKIRTNLAKNRFVLI